MRVPTLTELQSISRPLLKADILKLYDVSKTTLQRRINEGAFPRGMTLIDKRRMFWTKDLLIEHYKYHQKQAQKGLWA